eukprot:CAMPEP_0113506780 /NCGR_PEP_ID=MMETSP0014_2-20120614/36098_1 /TAXON_ID=2857 /ORGANISM="Nitzschia sp." /LENGTH=118 /DNA_ID=CAMNT_0000402313 /DNA_START=316 /DNA_END=669 /DNA_ORIENTATION=- /assembly_acc=CAM_ASM_000159
MSVVKVTVLFFASAREAAGGISQTTVEFDTSSSSSSSSSSSPPPPSPQQQQEQQPPPNPNPTTATLRQKLASMYPQLSKLVLDEDNLTLALNEEYVEPGNVVTLKTGDTVALIPPISG